MVVDQNEVDVDFVVSVGCSLSMVEQLRDRASRQASTGDCHEVALVSSPSYSVLDSGCGCTFIGAKTLKVFECQGFEGV